MKRLSAALAGLFILMVLACGAPAATPLPTSTAAIQPTADGAIEAASPTPSATPTPSRAASVATAVKATIEAIPTATAKALPASTPTPTLVPTPTPTATPTFAQSYDLTTVTGEGLTLYYDPATTAQIQVSWVTDTYQETLGILSSLFGASSLPTSAYLLSSESYADIFGEGHPEWTQGFALPRAAEFYLNRAP